LDPLRGAPSWHTTCSSHRRQAICHLLPTSNSDQVLLRQEASLSIQAEQLTPYPAKVENMVSF